MILERGAQAVPIPAFDQILNVLPPHLGDPRDASQLSPYPCTIAELCGRFATSAKRHEILRGLLSLRQALFDLGISGFQWVGGSFLEDIEAQNNRDPRDIDVVTFVGKPERSNDLALQITTRNPMLLDRVQTKTHYLVDHFLIPLGMLPHQLVDQSRYWYGLFSHRRDGAWKGMLAIQLIDRGDDAAALATLGGQP